MKHAAAPAPNVTAAAMIPKSPSRWQQAMREAITDPAELLSLLGLDAASVQLAKHPLENFPLRVPRGFVARMRHGDPLDPLLLQILPRHSEGEPAAGFVADPVGDLASLQGPGLLHKYPSRALLITTGACALHCRYCFRREFPYASEHAGKQGWQSALQTLRADNSLKEIILSGGDPLSLSNAALARLSDALDGIPHLQRLRIHTRTPIVLPERIDRGFLHWLNSGRLQKVIVVHSNHAQEIDAEVARAVATMRATGTPLFNQAVLLKGINDQVERLAALSERLFEVGIVPYYLHQLDRVRGASHFEVDEPRALRLHAALRDRLPGYLLPRLVREIPGELSKHPLSV